MAILPVTAPLGTVAVTFVSFNDCETCLHAAKGDLGGLSEADSGDGH